MSKLNTNDMREYWSIQPDSILKRDALKLCDDYDIAMQTIVLNAEQAKQALAGNPVKGKLVRFGETYE